MAAIAIRWGFPARGIVADRILIGVIVVGGLPMVAGIVGDLFRRELGADALAAIAVVTALILHEYLAGSLIVLMLSGGALLETFAVRSASSVLNALLKRMPTVAHRKSGDRLEDVRVAGLKRGDTVVIFPHEVAPVDGDVIEGHGSMDESYLTGEPFHMPKAPGAEVYSGAINGEAALTIRASRPPVESRYAKITEVMRAAEEKKPRFRRLADQLGAFYTPLALAVAVGAWIVSGDPKRYLAVIVVATPCPLIIAIPVAIIGAISLAAKRGIIIKNPLALEQIDLCRTAIFDKTGTLTYGHATLTDVATAPGVARTEVLALAASLERYSKHPLAEAVRAAAEREQILLHEVDEVSERAGEGLRGRIEGRDVRIVGRKAASQLPGWIAETSAVSGLECFVVLDGRYAARLGFRDAPRAESPAFIRHLGPRHAFERQLIISGDRESEVRYLADAVGITEVHAGKSPEEKLTLVRAETAKAKTLYIGDGVNDAPALLAATVGIAVGQNSDVTSEAAGVVIMESSLHRVDEFIHISERLRAVALQSAMGGMILSLAGMAAAALGYLPPVAGAITQELIDVLAIANAFRAAFPPRQLTDL